MINPNDEQILVRLHPSEPPEGQIVLTDDRSSPFRLGEVLAMGVDVHTEMEVGHTVLVNKNRGTDVPENPTDRLVFAANHDLKVYNVKDIVGFWDE